MNSAANYSGTPAVVVVEDHATSQRSRSTQRSHLYYVAWVFGVNVVLLVVLAAVSVGSLRPSWACCSLLLGLLVGLSVLHCHKLRSQNRWILQTISGQPASRH